MIRARERNQVAKQLWPYTLVSQSGGQISIEPLLLEDR